MEGCHVPSDLSSPLPPPYKYSIHCIQCMTVNFINYKTNWFQTSQNHCKTNHTFTQEYVFKFSIHIFESISISNIYEYKTVMKWMCLHRLNVQTTGIRIKIISGLEIILRLLWVKQRYSLVFKNINTCTFTL